MNGTSPNDKPTAATASPLASDTQFNVDTVRSLLRAVNEEAISSGIQDHLLTDPDYWKFWKSLSNGQALALSEPIVQGHGLKSQVLRDVFELVARSPTSLSGAVPKSIVDLGVAGINRVSDRYDDYTYIGNEVWGALCQDHGFNLWMQFAAGAAFSTEAITAAAHGGFTLGKLRDVVSDSAKEFSAPVGK